MMKLKFWMTLTVLALTACSTTFVGNKVDYKSQGKQAPTLEIPPDLSLLTKHSQASVPPGGAANASAFQANAAAASTVTANATAANRLGDVRVVHDGTQRWLVSERAPEKLWDEIKNFWTDNGLTIIIDQPNLGIMETDWNENRAKLPQDGFRKIFGKLLDSLYSTNERDKYRTRLERTASGGSEIYISHRGLFEDFTNSARTNLVWKPRPADPELEVEFLKRLMVRLGGAQEVANTALNSPKVAAVAPVATRANIEQDATQSRARANIEQDAAQSSLVLGDTFDQAWRRVGLSLDRTNFTVEDRDRAKGIYFVRYVEAEAEKNQAGFFTRLFGTKSKESSQKYQILLINETSKTRVRVADTSGRLIDMSETGKTRVRVADMSGRVLNTAEAKNILKVLLDDLK